MSNKATFRQRFPGVTSIFRNGALLTGTQWAETGLRAIYAVLIGRFLGPELYGVWSFALATYAFAIGFTFFGLETLVPMRLGRDRHAGAFLGTTFLVRLTLVIIAMVAVAAHAVAFEDDALSRTALLIVLPALAGRGLVLWARSVFLGLESSQIAFRLAFSLRLFELAAGLSCLLLGAGLYSLLIIHAVAWLAEAALSFFALSQQNGQTIRFDWAELRGVLKRGGILGLSTSGLVAMSSMPLIMSRYVTDDQSVVGQLAMAMQVAGLVVMGVQGIFAAALPVVSRASAKGDPRLKFYGLFAGIGVAVVFGVALVVAQMVGPSVFKMLLGDGFALSGTLIVPALVSAAIMVAPTGVWHILVTNGRIWSGVFAGWFGAMTLFLTLPPMIQMFGASGALIAAAFGWSLRAVILIGWALIPISFNQ